MDWVTIKLPYEGPPRINLVIHILRLLIQSNLQRMPASWIYTSHSRIAKAMYLTPEFCPALIFINHYYVD